MEGDIKDAAEHDDYRSVWRLGRVLARTGLGPKRRVFAPPDQEPILTSEWHEYMQDMFGAVATPQPNLLDRAHLAYPPLAVQMEAVDHKDMLKEICRQKNNRQTIAGSVPSEVWKIIYKFCVPVAQLMHKGPFEMIRATATPPMAWCCSPMWPIDKHNM